MMNRFGIYYAFWTNDWDADFLPYVDKVAGLGFDILEVNAGTIARMSSRERLALAARARERGLELSYCIGLTADHDVSSEDESVRRKGVAFLEAMARAIGEMGGGKLSGIIYGYWPATIARVEEKARRLEKSLKSMREAVKVAEDEGVSFNVEVVNRFEQFLLNTCDEALEYVARVGSPNLKILLDTYHMNIEEDDICAAIRKAGSSLGHLHIGENNRKPPSYGHIPWQGIGETLRSMEYNGSIVMEPFLVPGGEVGRDIKVWRDLMPGADLDAEAGKALAFVRKTLA
jgi:D-psicose/D-tagatose/L-ribulose 3-epimerase